MHERSEHILRRGERVRAGRARQASLRAAFQWAALALWGVALLFGIEATARGSLPLLCVSGAFSLSAAYCVSRS